MFRRTNAALFFAHFFGKDGAGRAKDTVTGTDEEASRRSLTSYLWPNRKAGQKDIWELIDDKADGHMNSATYGFAARAGFVFALCGGFLWSGYYSIKRTQKEAPLAKKLLAGWVPITLKERFMLEDGETMLLRFALPDPADTCGWDPVSSVRLSVPKKDGTHQYAFYTPISHPDQRGVIEFAVKDKRRTASYCLRDFPVGARCYMGTWLKEFQYKPKEYSEIDMVACGTGLTPALQLLNVMSKEKQEPDSTKMKLLSCQQSPQHSIFLDKMLTLEEKMPFDRFKVKHLTTQGKWTEGFSAAGRSLVGKGATGFVSEGPLTAFLGPPTTGGTFTPRPLSSRAKEDVKRWCDNKGLDSIPEGLLSGSTLSDGTTPDTRGRKILISGPPVVMGVLCGPSLLLPLPWWSHPRLYYRGLMKDLGYPGHEVYSFGYNLRLLTS